MPPRSSTFIEHEDGGRHVLAYRVRLLSNLFVDEGEPGEVEHHAGEVIVMDARETIQALAGGYGVLVGEIIDGIRCGPLQCTLCGAKGYGPCRCPRPVPRQPDGPWRP